MIDLEAANPATRPDLSTSSPHLPGGSFLCGSGGSGGVRAGRWTVRDEECGDSGADRRPSAVGGPDSDSAVDETLPNRLARDPSVVDVTRPFATVQLAVDPVTFLSGPAGADGRASGEQLYSLEERHPLTQGDEGGVQPTASGGEKGTHQSTSWTAIMRSEGSSKKLGRPDPCVFPGTGPGPGPAELPLGGPGPSLGPRGTDLGSIELEVMLASTLIAGDFLNRRAAVGEKAIDRSSAGSVFFTSDSIAAASSKRFWQLVIFGLGTYYLYYGIIASIALSHGTRFSARALRFVPLVLRSGTVPNASASGGSGAVGTLGVLQGGCRLA